MPSPPIRPRRLSALAAALAAGTALALAGVGTASAATSRSSSTNWAGYAVAKVGTRFRHVSGTWVQPAVDCTSASGTDSAVWVGLGGLRGTSTALEQIGTEADCSASGRATYSTWYELVPDTSHSAQITVRPGDTMHASAAVAGTAVTLTIKNVTRGTSFTKVLRTTNVDVTSAEWIVEAPSLCTISGACATSSLAAFATTTFTAAQAVSATGHAGSVADVAWHANAIDLRVSGARRFAGPGRDPVDDGGGGSATTGALSADGASFAVTYDGTEAVSTTTQTDPAQTAPSPWQAARR